MKKDKSDNDKQTNSENTEQVGKKQRKHAPAKVVKTAVLGTVLGLCASAIVGLSVALYYSQKSIQTHETYQRQMDAVYSRAYYDLLDGASDLGINLRKISVSNSPKMQQSLLYEVWSAAQLAEDNLGMFESQDDGILKAQKFVNQLGDYTHTLALRVADGHPLTAEERQKLVQMGDMADTYKKALQSVQKNLEDGQMFIQDGGALDNFASAFSEFSEPSFEYPEMIYDGPFSSALENRQTYGLTGADISRERGEQLIKECFQSYRPRDLKFVGQSDGDIVTLDYTFVSNDDNCYAQIAKRGGMLISFNTAPRGEQSVAIVDASETCQQSALRFASLAGFDDMQVVWSSSADGECVINLAPVQDGVILYPDLVKVKVREDDLRVIGFDSTHYAFNHRARTLQSPIITAEEARASLSLPAITDGRLALIPLRETKEVLTYEFECHSDGTYYVYLDVDSGEEVNILYVVSDSAGTRTM